MGCASSKLDDLPAVALCLERCCFLDEAIHQRYALAEAHVSYIHSLKGVGLSLRRFFDQHLDASSVSPPSPVLNLPSQRKGEPEPAASPSLAAAMYHSHSDSGSHVHFHDSEDDDSASDAPHHHLDVDLSPVHNPYGDIGYADNETLASYPGGGRFMNMNYMKHQATASVVYEHRPTGPETLHMDESSSYNPYPYSNPNPSYYLYHNYSNYAGFFGSSPTQPYASSPPPPLGPSLTTSSSKPPTPPPSPPKASAWDFLNPFEDFEKYYRPHTPTRDSREVREEEGIPDLEDEDYQEEVVKEVHGEQKFVDGGGGGGGDGSSYSKGVADDEDRKVNDSESQYRTRPIVSMENDPVEYEVHVVDEKVVDSEGRSGDGGNAVASKARGNLRGDSEVLSEIEVQFARASESGTGLAKMLEVGKLPYNRKHAAYQVSSKMLHVTTSLPVASSQPYASQNAVPSIGQADPTYLDLNEDVGLRSGNLSSTLQKLHLWEKKLYEEVKVEEKMRMLHERKCRKLKRLDERGADAHKVDSTRTLVRSLSTKIRIAIQVVDKISMKINKLRDEELWPQLNEFVHGLTRMWKSMLECHHNQCHAIGEARRLDSVASHKHLSDAHLEATLQLERELLNWTLRFSCWISSQKGFVRALNNWLLKCLLYEPEETADGIVPFSPGRIGAPPVFIICNQWSQALEQISEKEVVDSMRDFAKSLLQLWERDKLEMCQRIMVDKDVERKVKNLEREDLKIQKEIQALDKKMALVSGDSNGLSVTGQVVYQSDTNKNGNIKRSLQRIFEAMEMFTADNLRAYEELLQRIEEDGLARVP